MAERYTGRTLREIVRVVASRFVGMAVIFIVVVGAAVVATRFQPRTYRSRVQLEATPSRMTNPLESRTAARDEMLFIAKHREIILSDYVLASATMRLDGIEIASSATETDSQVRQWISENLSRLAKVTKRVKVVTPGSATSYTQTFSIRVDWTEDREKAREIGIDSRQFAANQANKMAGCVLEAYLSRYKQLASRRAKAATKFLSDKSLVAAKAHLERATSVLENYISENLKGDDLLQVVHMLNRSSGTEMGSAKLGTISQAEINDIDANLAELNTISSVLDTEIAKKDATKIVVPDVVNSDNDSIKKLQTRLVDLKLQLTSLKTRYTGKYQKVRDITGEMLAVYTELRAELVRHRTRIGQDVARLNSRRAKLDSIAVKDRDRVAKLASKVAAYEKISKDVSAAQIIYDREQERVVSAGTAEQLAENPILVSVLDEPSIPDPKKPHRPIVLLNLLIAVGGGLVLAMIYAFMSDHFDHTIKSIDEAERYLGIAVLTSVPKLGRKIIRVG